MKTPRARLFALSLLAASLPAAAATPVTPPDPSTVVVRSAGGSKTIAVVEKGNAIEITFPTGEKLFGEPSREKRKYRPAAGGPQRFEVKPGENGFKLRTSDGKLLWKVKVDADEIEVSDDEENANPYSLETKHEDEVKVVDASEKEVAEVRFAAEKTKVEGPDGAELWETSSPRRRAAAFGVLALEKVPLEHRAVLMAEILARRR